MGKIVVSENVTLDGVVQDPAGDEGFKLGGWIGAIKDRPQLNKLALDEALGAAALLLGRRSYEWFAARASWNNSSVIGTDVLSNVSKLKQQLAGDIVIPASFQLVHTLIEHDLVDELRLKIFPVVLGAGERLFGPTSAKKPMRLLNTQIVEDDVLFLTYQAVRDA
jgi:dihydrofolate reductase